MDYDNLLYIHSFENHELQNQRYKKIKDSKDISQAGKIEVEKAKSILSVVSPKSNLSLYDHLCSIIRRVLRLGINDAVDKLEEISKSIKEEKRPLEDEIECIRLSDENLETYIKKKKKLFYRLHSTDETDLEIRTSTESDDDAEQSEKRVNNSEKGASDLRGVLPDLHYKINRFKLDGIGLSDEEVCELVVGLRNLAQTQALKSVHFWGKIFANKCNYFIAESPYQDDVTREDFDRREQSEEEKSIPSLLEEMNSDEYITEIQQAIKKLPISVEPKVALEEEDGTGINEKLYFVTTDKMDEWRCLPPIQPDHIVTAKRIKRFLTGDLEAEVRGGISFPGTEAHFLKAQIARITAATKIALENYYLTPVVDEDEEETATEWKPLLKNQEYVPKSVEEVFDGGLGSWVHCERSISDQGRRLKVKSEQNKTESLTNDAVSDEDPEKETDTTLLRSLSKDSANEKIPPWTMKLSSKSVPEASVLIVRSNLWPGAYTYYDGKYFDNIYIGYGFKYSRNHYAPVLPIKMQKEYPTDSPNFIEEEDESEIEDNVLEESDEILEENSEVLEEKQ